MGNGVGGRSQAVGVVKVDSRPGRFYDERREVPLVGRGHQTGIKQGRFRRPKIPDIAELIVGGVTEADAIAGGAAITAEKEAGVIVDGIDGRLKPEGNGHRVGVQIQGRHGHL